MEVQHIAYVFARKGGAYLMLNDGDLWGPPGRAVETYANSFAPACGIMRELGFAGNLAMKPVIRGYEEDGIRRLGYVLDVDKSDLPLPESSWRTAEQIKNSHDMMPFVQDMIDEVERSPVPTKL